jgi:hypothetical protein
LIIAEISAKVILQIKIKYIFKHEDLQRDYIRKNMENCPKSDALNYSHVEMNIKRKGNSNKYVFYGFWDVYKVFNTQTNYNIRAQ